MPVDFSPYHAVLLDLDGTVYHEDRPLPGAIELIRRLQADSRKFACLSNSTSSPLRAMVRLQRMGVQMDPDHIYTAAAAACDYIVRTFPSRDDPEPRRLPRVFNLATEAVDEMLQGLVGWVQTGGEPCDAVICGAPSNALAGEERQRVALQLLRRGAKLIGICADRVFPSQRGLEFGSGAFSWMMGYAAGVEPIFCGKPQPIFFAELCQRLQVDPAWCLLIGDNLEADVMGGKSQGMRTILTLTGVTRRRDVMALPEEMRPDLIVESLAELI
jgi:4-nitrophenyl phosphatase